MPVNLSVKNVPDDLAQRLRRRAERNRRSLQRELISILEAAVGHVQESGEDADRSDKRRPITIEELCEITRKLFPDGTESSVEYIRQMREGRR
jgi:plasmid stability protein